MLFMVTLVLGLFSCSSGDDEPKTQVPTNEGISTATFDSKVKGRLWVLKDVNTVMSDGNVYESVFWENHVVGGNIIQMNAFKIDGNTMTYFWNSPYNPVLKHHSREEITFTYDEASQELSLNTYLANKITYKVMSVDNDKLLLASFFGITPKNFNPEKYKDSSYDITEDLKDLDEGSYLLLTLYPATSEEAKVFWETYEENE